MSSRSPSQRAAEKFTDQDVATAEARGAERVRAQVRDVLADRRRVVRVGDAQVEVVEVSALDEVLGSAQE